MKMKMGDVEAESLSASTDRVYSFIRECYLGKDIMYNKTQCFISLTHINLKNEIAWQCDNSHFGQNFWGYIRTKTNNVE